MSNKGLIIEHMSRYLRNEQSISESSAKEMSVKLLEIVINHQEKKPPQWRASD